MIKKLTLHNFQSHKHTEVEFDPHVNVISGSSDSGKSALLRAIYWVINNRPTGNDFLLSHWARDAKGNQKENMYVSVEYDTNDICIREKTKTTNTYTLNDKTLEAIGIDVPEEVRLFNNFSEVNISKQMDAPFLLSESAGEVARFFNRIVHFDIIDEYLISIESMRKKNNQDIRYTTDEIKTINEQIDNLQWVHRAEEILHQIDLLDIDQKWETLKTLQQSITDYKKSQDAISALEVLITQASILVDSIQRCIIEYVGLKNKQGKLVQLIKLYHETIDALDTVDVTYAGKICTRIDKTLNKISDTYTTKNKLDKSIREYKDTKKDLESTQKNLQEAMSKLPTVCPLCGGLL